MRRLLAKKTTFRVEFTVDRRGGALRKAIEGTNLEAMLKKVDKMDGYNVVLAAEAVTK